MKRVAVIGLVSSLISSGLAQVGTSVVMEIQPKVQRLRYNPTLVNPWDNSVGHQEAVYVCSVTVDNPPSNSEISYQWYPLFQGGGPPPNIGQVYIDPPGNTAVVTGRILDFPRDLYCKLYSYNSCARRRHIYP
jgi:hypothetical protein